MKNQRNNKYLYHMKTHERINEYIYPLTVCGSAHIMSISSPHNFLYFQLLRENI